MQPPQPSPSPAWGFPRGEDADAPWQPAACSWQWVPRLQTPKMLPCRMPSALQKRDQNVSPLKITPQASNIREKTSTLCDLGCTDPVPLSHPRAPPVFLSQYQHCRARCGHLRLLSESFFQHLLGWESIPAPPLGGPVSKADALLTTWGHCASGRRTLSSSVFPNNSKEGLS